MSRQRWGNASLCNTWISSWKRVNSNNINIRLRSTAVILTRSRGGRFPRICCCLWSGNWRTWFCKCSSLRGCDKSLICENQTSLVDPGSAFKTERIRSPRDTLHTSQTGCNLVTVKYRPWDSVQIFYKPTKIFCRSIKNKQTSHFQYSGQKENYENRLYTWKENLIHY